MVNPRMLLCVAVLLASLPMAATAAGRGDAAIKVSLSRADSALPCDQVADQTQVYFDGRHAGFKPSHLQVLLNGERVPADQVHYAWPRVTLKGGLSPGRNTVELLVETPNGTEIDRSIVVKVGDSVHSADGVSLACQPVVAAAAPQVETPVTRVYEVAPAVEPPTVVYSAPVSTYYSYPYYSYPYYSYPYYGYYRYPGYYGFGGPAITLGFGGCFGCGWHGYGGYHHWGGYYHGYHHWHH